MAHAAQTAPGYDPRKIITPESFHVAPHLLGLPLASPWRRLAAILVDLFLVAVLSKSGKVFFALALAVAFFWIAGKKLGKGGGFFSRTVRVGLRSSGALFLFIAGLSVWNSARRSVTTAVEDGGDTPRPATMSVNGRQQQPEPRNPTLGGAARVAIAVAVLEHAHDSAAAYDAATNAARQLRRLHLTDAQIRETLTDESKNRPETVRAGVRAALAVLDSTGAASADSAAADSAGDGTEAVDSAALAARADEAAAAAGPDSLAALYVSTLHRGDSARAGRLRPKLASLLARDSLDELRGQVTELRGDKRELEQEKEKAENRGLLSILLEWLDDLGIGIGWTGLYFTAFTALWRGQTPGKKLFGIRVLRLDGLPMTLWASFERFGGYAAGLFTGLTGYLQVFWDRNRQAIQDKISETVVIRERPGTPVPTPPPVAPRPAPPRWPPAGVGAP